MARRNQEEQSVFVKDYLGCGMSLRTYALEKGIGVSTLSRWVRQQWHSVKQKLKICYIVFKSIS